MAYIQVTSSELRTKAEELRGLNQRFTQEIENMLSHQNNLNSMWEGEAKEAFNQAFNQDKGKLDNFKNSNEIMKMCIKMNITCDTIKRTI